MTSNRYNKPEAIKDLENLAQREAEHRYPDTPPHLLAPRRYRDDTANALTRCIVDYIRFNGGSAFRINSQGQYDPGLKRWRHSGQRKGLPDIQATINGQSVHIEVKIGRDRLSEYQVQVKNEIEASGGLYFVAKDFTTFKTWLDEIKENPSWRTGV